MQPKLDGSNKPDPPPGPRVPLQVECDPVLPERQLNIILPLSIQWNRRRLDQVIELGRAILLHVEWIGHELCYLRSVEPEDEANVIKASMGSRVFIFCAYDNGHLYGESTGLAVGKMVQIGVRDG